MPLLPSNIHLPVTEVLEELKSALNRHHEAILQAPPGAGKTTLVPLALAAEPWLGDRKILILEPRRIATRAAAHRMADLLGESVGQTVGYRMRLDTRVSSSTKIEVITEGILTRMLQEDPSLVDVGLVIFDEFHERSLDADLALALCLKGRSLFREDDPLKLLIMSATLDSHKLEELTGAPVMQSEGKQYPVDIIYGKASQPRDSINDKTVAATLRALADNPESSILVFLPGQGEIRSVEDALAIELHNRKISGVHLCPLYGNLSLEAQQAAVAPVANPGERKNRTCNQHRRNQLNHRWCGCCYRHRSGQRTCVRSDNGHDPAAHAQNIPGIEHTTNGSGRQIAPGKMLSALVKKPAGSDGSSCNAGDTERRPRPGCAATSAMGHQ